MSPSVMFGCAGEVLRRRTSYFILIAAGLLWSVSGAKPELEHIHPLGAGQGTTNIITLSGTFEPWPPQIWVEGTGVECSFETNKGKVQFILATKAPPGPRLVRVYNSEGASEPRIFVIGEHTEMAEKEPNDHYGKPASVANFPIFINGQLEKNGDVDSYLVPLQSGEWLDARMQNYTLMGKIDGVLRLLTREGAQLAWNHDSGTLDPHLAWQSPIAQEVVLQVFGFAYPANSEIRLAGGPGGSYRLHLDVTREAPKTGCGPPGHSEPNDGQEQAGMLMLPARLSGEILDGEDEDWFAIEVEKDVVYLMDLESAVGGSPLDAWLKISDEAGQELARSDDADGSADPKLEWKSTRQGKVYLAVGSVTHRGSEKHTYTLRVEQAEPDFAASLESSTFAIPPGGTNEIKVKVERLHGFTHNLEVAGTGLPEGVNAQPVSVPEKGGELVLRLVAATNAPASNGPFQVQVRDTTAEREKNACLSFTARTVNNGVPGGYTSLLVEDTDQVWLTVLAPPADGLPK